MKPKSSKFAERRKEEQERLKGLKPANGKPGKDVLRRSASPRKRSDGKDFKITKPAPKSGYKGTMGISGSGKRSQDAKAKKSRYDDYLGTDEEEDSDMAEGEEGDGYYSDASSDNMEAGFEDMEGEDRMALRHAKDDDAREQALESQHRREKEERRRKAMALAAKHSK